MANYLWGGGVTLVAKSCQTLWDPVDCSPPGSSVCEIFQARILEWVTMPSSRGSSWPRDRPHRPALQVDSFTSEPLEKPNHLYLTTIIIYNIYIIEYLYPDQITGCGFCLLTRLIDLPLHVVRPKLLTRWISRESDSGLITHLFCLPYISLHFSYPN